LLVGFRPQGSVAGWAAAFGLLLLLSFAMSWVAAAIGLLVRSVEAAQSAGFIWLFPLTFASSAFVQTQTMPGPLRAFADHQPVTTVVDAVRAFLLGRPVGTDGWVACAWCAGLLVVFVPLAVSLYQRRTAR
jgi:ABC-type multidrug transport system permease subunit